MISISDGGSNEQASTFNTSKNECLSFSYSKKLKSTINEVLGKQKSLVNNAEL